jgi:3-methyladenine DNA glycosylase/8-oxoguanine DNA glycosylase
MEFHHGRPDRFMPLDYEWATLRDIYEHADAYASVYHRESLEHFRKVRPCDSKELFWPEYIWCVYTAGFSAKVITKIFPALMSAYGGPPDDDGFGKSPIVSWEAVMKINANRRRFRSVIKCQGILSGYGWPEFNRRYLQYVDDMEKLPGIGRVTKYHLARNLGFDVVKPDLHLERLRKWYGFTSSLQMCEMLAHMYEERLGVVDFVLWAYCAAFGSPKERVEP